MRPIRFEPYLIEEVVFLRVKQAEALGQKDLVRSFHEARTLLYAKADEEDLKQGFQDMAWSFFRSFGLDQYFLDLFQEFPLLLASDLNVHVKSTFHKNQERAELFVDTFSQTLIVSLRVHQLLDISRLAPFLRHELMHISDMLDLEFHYDPKPVLGGTGQIEEELVRDRFRVLWNLYVSVRLAQSGRTPYMPFDDLKGEFEKSFSHLEGDGKEKVIRDFLERKRWTQSDLIQLARNDRSNRLLGEGGLRCPLCHFTSYEGKRFWGAEHRPIMNEIQNDFPGWTSSEGLCTQCFDLYDSRVRVTT